MHKEFAPDQAYEMVGNNKIYEFPTDTEWRSQLFIDKVMKHPAKMNLYLLKAIIEYVSEPGERIMDVMSGTGSIMIAATMGRKVFCIEISDKFFDWICQSKDIIEKKYPETKGSIVAIQGACQDILPVPTDHIIFSPPYAAIMKKKKITAGDITADLYGVTEEDFTEYSKNPGNVGNMNRFFYNQAMEGIYQQCYDSLSPGGTLSIVIKDYIEGGKRIYLSDWVIKSCIRMGFEQYGWFKWLALGSPFVRIRRARGEPTVDDEDIIIMRKPAVVPATDSTTADVILAVPVLAGASA